MQNVRRSVSSGHPTSSQGAHIVQATAPTVWIFFFSSRRRHTRWNCDWSSDVCSSDLFAPGQSRAPAAVRRGTHHMNLARREPRWAVAFTVLLALILQALPLPTWLEAVRPSFVGIVVIYWAIRSEERRVGKECRSRVAA